MAESSILLYLLRKDLQISDNTIFKLLLPKRVTTSHTFGGFVMEWNAGVYMPVRFINSHTRFAFTQMRDLKVKQD
jgi:hypothetical protein